MSRTLRHWIITNCIIWISCHELVSILALDSSICHELCHLHTDSWITDSIMHIFHQLYTRHSQCSESGAMSRTLCYFFITNCISIMHISRILASTEAFVCVVRRHVSKHSLVFDEICDSRRCSFHDSRRCFSHNNRAPIMLHMRHTRFGW